MSWRYLFVYRKWLLDAKEACSMLLILPALQDNSMQSGHSQPALSAAVATGAFQHALLLAHASQGNAAVWQGTGA